MAALCGPCLYKLKAPRIKLRCCARQTSIGEIGLASEETRRHANHLRLSRLRVHYSNGFAEYICSLRLEHFIRELYSVQRQYRSGQMKSEKTSFFPLYFLYILRNQNCPTSQDFTHEKPVILFCVQVTQQPDLCVR